jgi:hypothetical protein
MDQKRKSNLGAGLALILIGAWFLAVRLVPELQAWQIKGFTWPLIVIAVGAGMLILGLFSGSPAMAEPAFVIAGIGGLLYWQNQTGNWESWAYAWTIIPGLSGLGMIVHGLLGGDTRRRVIRGARSVLVSAILFLIFGSFFGGLDILGPYWPALLIGAGIYMLVRAMLPRSTEIRTAADEE